MSVDRISNKTSNDCSGGGGDSAGDTSSGGCLHPSSLLLPCCPLTNWSDAAAASDHNMIRNSKQHSNAIDRQIAKDKEDFVRTHRLLLLGAGESGKSTILKQMQLIHMGMYSDTQQRIMKREDIRNNLLEAIVSILSALPTLSAPSIGYDCEEHCEMAEWILGKAAAAGAVNAAAATSSNKSLRRFEFTVEFYRCVKVLWRNDRGVRAAFERSNEFQLIDSAQYFLDKVDLIAADDYIPTEQDIIRCRVLTNGIYELHFMINNVKFLMTDVGGQRDERRKWFLCFNDVTAIIFVTACSSYDMVLREDATKNRLRESLELFKVVWHNRWLCHISVILFLNKQDLLAAKIGSGRRRLDDYFPDFREYVLPKEAATAATNNEHIDVTRAKHFIRNEFEKLTCGGDGGGGQSSSSGVGGKNYHNKNHEQHRCYPHFTCAIDTENIKRVFDDCRDSIQRKYLTDYDLI